MGELQDYRRAEELYRQLARLDSAQPRWPLLVAACLHTQGLATQVHTRLPFPFTMNQ